MTLAGCSAQEQPGLAIGSSAPAFSLPGIDGKVHTLGDYAASPVLAVVFTCNHCPASELYERRINRLYQTYFDRGVALVAINPDSPKSVRLDEMGYTDADDSLSGMKARASSGSFAIRISPMRPQTVATQFGVVAMRIFSSSIGTDPALPGTHRRQPARRARDEPRGAGCH